MNREKIIKAFTGPIPLQSRIGFYLDENIDQRIVDKLTDLGVYVRTVEQEDQKSEQDDYRLLTRARELGCVLVTQDNDFHGINKHINQLWLTEGTSHAGIVFFEGEWPVGRIIDALVDIREKWKPEQMISVLWVV